MDLIEHSAPGVDAKAEAVLRAAQRGDGDGLARLLDAEPGLVGCRDGDGRAPSPLAERLQDEFPRTRNCNSLSRNRLFARTRRHPLLMRSMWPTRCPVVYVCQLTGYTPLHRASYNGRLRAIGVLLSRGADVDARTREGWTPLHSAARWAKAKAVTLLLENGANVNARTDGGQTALHLASSTSSLESTEGSAAIDCSMVRRRPRSLAPYPWPCRSRRCQLTIVMKSQASRSAVVAYCRLYSTLLFHSRFSVSAVIVEGDGASRCAIR